MEETIEAPVQPEAVWAAWEKKVAEGDSKLGKIRYKVLEVRPGEGFSLLWKTLFVRMIFSHSVKKAPRGSFISYRVEIKGLFALPIRWLLKDKIKENLSLVLKSVAKDLER